MGIRRLLQGLSFVVTICAFGTWLTAVDAGPAPRNRLLFVLFGANGRADVDCTGDRPAMPCSAAPPRVARASVEIVDLGTDPPTHRASIDLGVAVPTSLAVAPDGGRFYVVDSGRRRILTVATSTGAITATTHIPEDPIDCTLSRDGTSLYVTTAKPSVVTVATAPGTVVSEVAPRQPYAERFSGIALDPAPGSDQLAVAATSSAPAVYFFKAESARVTVDRRVAATGTCTEPTCGGGDDVAYTGDGRVLLANLECGQLYTLAAARDAQSGVESFGTHACLAPNPQNSLLWSSLARRAYVVWRRYSMGIAPGMAAVDPADLHATLLTTKARVPEAAALTPDGRSLYIVSKLSTRGLPRYQIKGPIVFVLEACDTAAGTLPQDVYTFGTPIEDRAAIDARIVEVTSGLPLTGVRGLGGVLGQVSLLIFGGALFYLDCRRSRRGA